MKPTFLASAFATLCLAPAALAQHVKVNSLGVQPNNPTRLWVCNRDNDTVSVVNLTTRTIVAEIPVGVDPRTIAFSADGSRAFVTNKRGNIPREANEITGFPAGSIPGTVSVINTATLALQTTLSGVGVEPYGVATAPNGKYFVVGGMRSATLRFFDAATLVQVAALDFPSDLSSIPAGMTMADVDANRDGMADLGNPRGFSIWSDSTKLVVTHHKSPFVSVVSVQLNAQGVPTGASVAAKIDTDDYHFDPVFNPTPVRTIQSQGEPRFLEDVAISPDGTRALVPHVLHNINHDVNFDFAGAITGDHANRVYPALTMVDLVANSYGVAGDFSRRLHHQIADTRTPAEYVPFGSSATMPLGDVVSLGGSGIPTLGSTATLKIDGMRPGDSAVLLLGRREINQTSPILSQGNFYVAGRVTVPVVGDTATFAIPAAAAYDGKVFVAQAVVTRGGQNYLSNGLRIFVRSQHNAVNKLGHHAGQPGLVSYNNAGSRVLLLNRASEDLFLYKVAGSNFEYMTAYPPRFRHQERQPLDTTTAMGDIPIGMVVVDDTKTVNDDALVHIHNEGTRTLSTLRVNWKTGQISKAAGQLALVTGVDKMTASQRLGQEMFEDASRAQIADHFNNSCASCHFEGGEDGNVWQRPAGPRSTMPMYGGIRATGLLLWKGQRLNAGETGPMFHGENGGTGVFSAAEQQAMIDFHETLPIPLNPHRDPTTHGLTSQALVGKDLFFGTNDTGFNPTNRSAGCAVCHPRETASGTFAGPRFFTQDFLNPLLTTGDNLGPAVDPNCFSLRENIVALNIRNINSGLNVDDDGDGVPELDRNADGYSDLESYTPMNVDGHDDFRRDDPNSYDCPCDPALDGNCDAGTSTRIFSRSPGLFSIPTKLGVFATAPYFHDHSSFTLRSILDPQSQMTSPVYGTPAFPGQTPYPGLQKFFNEFHDVRGHEQFVQGASKVQTTLNSTNVDADIEALLAYIKSL